MDSDAIFYVQTVALIVILGVALVLGSVSFTKNQVRAACDRFALESDRETRYVEYTYWNVDCLTPTENGKWISIEMLREVE